MTRTRFLLLPSVIFVAAILVGATITLTVYRAENLTRQTEFNRLADEAHDRIVARLEQHFALLTATESLYKSAQGKVSRPQFSAFVEGLELDETYSGIRGIGFARLLPTAERPRAEAEILENYGVQRQVHPQSGQEFMTPIVLLEPMDDRNEAALGYDMFSEQTRHTAMLAAISTGRPQASGPVELVQEITSSKQAGFLVYHPLQIGAGDEFSVGTGGVAVSGFVYAAFRTDDLFRASLATGLPLPLNLRVVDVEAPDIVLFQSDAGAWPRVSGGLSAQQTVTIFGREWAVEMRATNEFLDGYNHTESYLLAAMSLLLALAAASGMRAKQREVRAWAETAVTAAQSAEDRSEMLLELKHRIKNHIARIQAIARHTLRSSKDMESFSTVFSARLQAMANAQDLLTQDGTHTAELRDILQGELRQIFEIAEVDRMLDGPDIRLDGRQSRAMGLVAHELTTNVMKYNSLSAQVALSVRWSIRQEAQNRFVDLIWKETTEPRNTLPAQPGFGTRLVDMSVTGDLDGSIDRDFEEDGLRLRISFPVSERSADLN